MDLSALSESQLAEVEQLLAEVHQLRQHEVDVRVERQHLQTDILTADPDLAQWLHVLDDNLSETVQSYVIQQNAVLDYLRLLIGFQD